MTLLFEQYHSSAEVSLLVWDNFDQESFHTDKAVNFLDNSEKWVI
jgi:hypothetical protein